MFATATWIDPTDGSDRDAVGAIGRSRVERLDSGAVDRLGRSAVDKNSAAGWLMAACRAALMRLVLPETRVENGRAARRSQDRVRTRTQARTQTRTQARAQARTAAVTQDPSPASEATQLLGQLSDGIGDAADRLLPLIYDELRKLAGTLMAGERAGHTLQPTALVNEAFVRLVQSESSQYEGRVHFLRVAARAMRNVLIDHARARRTQKRGEGAAQVTLDEGIAFAVDDAEGLIHVDETLQRLSAMDEQLGQIVELRFFGGLKDREIAAALGTSERSVQRGWRTARAWLSREMQRQERQDPQDHEADGS